MMTDRPLIFSGPMVKAPTFSVHKCNIDEVEL